MYDCQVSLSSPPPHHLFPLFLPSLLPSVFNPAQFARLAETILVISACNDTLLTPITTIKTLLPVGPFQVLINQMAARGRLHPYTHIHTDILVLTHTFSPALTDHVAPLKKTSGGTKHLHDGRQMPPLQMKGESLSLPFSFTLTACFSRRLCDVGIMNATSPLGTVPYWEGLESCPVCSSLIA